MTKNLSLTSHSSLSFYNKTSGIRLHKFFSFLSLRRIKFITRQFFPSFLKSHDQSGTRESVCYTDKESTTIVMIYNTMLSAIWKNWKKKEKKYGLHFPFLQSSSSFHQRHSFHYRRDTQGWKWIKARFVLDESKIQQ